ncbi:MAG: NTP transferase domain-containing protein [Planctomycetota bacterium]
MQRSRLRSFLERLEPWLCLIAIVGILFCPGTRRRSGWSSSSPHRPRHRDPQVEGGLAVLLPRLDGETMPQPCSCPASCWPCSSPTSGSRASCTARPTRPTSRRGIAGPWTSLPGHEEAHGLPMSLTLERKRSRILIDGRSPTSTAARCSCSTRPRAGATTCAPPSTASTTGCRSTWARAAIGLRAASTPVDGCSSARTAAPSRLRLSSAQARASTPRGLGAGPWTPSRPWALVLAAGDSRRMGREKALLDLGHGPAWAWLAAKLHEAGCARVLVAIPPRLADRVRRRALARGRRGRGPAPRGDRSARSRPRAAARHRRAAGSSPGRPPAGRGRDAAPCSRPRASCASPVHAGRRGHPVWVGAGHGPAILAGPASLRELFRGAGVEVAEVPVDDPAVLANLDRPEDLPGA